MIKIEDYIDKDKDIVGHTKKELTKLKTRNEELPNLMNMVSPYVLPNRVNEYANYTMNSNDRDALKTLSSIVYYSNIKNKYDEPINFNDTPKLIGGSSSFTKYQDKLKIQIFDDIKNLYVEPKEITNAIGLINTFDSRTKFLELMKQDKDYKKNPIINFIVKDMKRNSKIKDFNIYKKIMYETLKNNKKYFAFNDPTSIDYLQVFNMLGSIKGGASLNIIPTLKNKSYNFDINEIIEDLIRLRTKNLKDFQKEIKKKYKSDKKIKEDLLLYIKNILSYKNKLKDSTNNSFMNLKKQLAKFINDSKLSKENKRSKIYEMINLTPNFYKVDMLNYAQHISPFNVFTLDKKKFDIKYGMADVMSMLSSTFDTNVKKIKNNPFYINVNVEKKKQPNYWLNKVLSDVNQTTSPDKYMFDIMDIINNSKSNNYKYLKDIGYILHKYKTKPDFEKMLKVPQSVKYKKIMKILKDLE